MASNPNQSFISSESEENGSLRSCSNDSKTDSDSNSRKRKAISESENGDDLDLTTVEGQLRRNPGISEDKAKSQARREYNRLNAQKARKKNKEIVHELQTKVQNLSTMASKLKHENDVLKAQLEITEKQNMALMGSRGGGSAPAASAPAIPVAGPVSQPIQQNVDPAALLMALLRTQSNASNDMPSQISPHMLLQQLLQQQNRSSSNQSFYPQN